MTDHLSALVSVPVEPTEAMLDAWHKATWPQGPRVSPLSQQGLSFARAYRAMLAAAPAAPQAAGVGEAVHAWLREDASLATKMNMTPDVVARLVVRIESIRAPSREPEGGAVDDLREALIQADLKIRSLPGTDQSDVEFIRAALATREEAPAALCDHGHTDPMSLCSDCEAASVEALAEGAGEAMDAGFEAWLNERNLLPRGAWDWPSIVSMLNHHEDALLAQPKAREDAQPVISAGRVLADALRQYGFPVSGGAKAALSDHGSAEALALNEACVAFLAALQAEQKGGAA